MTPAAGPISIAVLLAANIGSAFEPAVRTPSPPLNALSASERADGYQLLFNGKDLQGWTAYRGNPSPCWKVGTAEADTFLHVDRGPQGHIVTQGNRFQDFDLKLEWKSPEHGNSGIYIRYLEAYGEWGGASGPEGEIVAYPWMENLMPKHRAGSSYDLIPVDSGRRDWARPAGQWNEFRIVAFGKRIAHYGNGLKLLEYEMHSPAWEEAYAASKYRSWPVFREVHPGAIYLEHHGETGFRFRNLRIKVLDAHQDPWSPASPYRRPDGLLVDSLDLADNLFAAPAGVPVLRPIAPDPSRDARRGRIRWHGPAILTFDILGKNLPPGKEAHTVPKLGRDRRPMI